MEHLVIYGESGCIKTKRAIELCLGAGIEHTVKSEEIDFETELMIPYVDANYHKGGYPVIMFNDMSYFGTVDVLEKYIEHLNINIATNVVFE